MQEKRSGNAKPSGETMETALGSDAAKVRRVSLEQAGGKLIDLGL